LISLASLGDNSPWPFAAHLEAAGVVFIDENDGGPGVPS
jgi:hypothetical protein